MENQNHDDEILGDEMTAETSDETSHEATDESAEENTAKEAKISVTQRSRRPQKEEVSAAKKLAKKAGLYDFGMAVESVEANRHDATEIVAALAHGEELPSGDSDTESESEASAADEDLELSAGHATEESADDWIEGDPQEESVDEILTDAVEVTNTEAGVSEAEVMAHQEDAAAELVHNAMGANPAEENAPFAGVEHDPGIHGELLSEEEEAESGESALAIPFRDLEGASLQAAVEATFFMHHKPIGISKLRELINPEIKEDEYRTAVSNLMASYWDDSKGIELAEVAGGFQFRTKPEHKDILRRMFQIAPMKLTNAMLEVLAIAAYNQPMTREGVDRVRGVDSSHLVRVLLDKKMLRIVGKSDEIGRPMLYGTTKEFLEVFGLRDLNALPSLRDIEDMLPKNEVGVEITEEEMLAKEMEGIVENSKPLEFNDLETDEEAEQADETQTAPRAEAAPAQTDGHGREEEISRPEISETGGDFHLSDEAAGRLPLGPEGHA